MIKQITKYLTVDERTSNLYMSEYDKHIYARDVVSNNTNISSLMYNYSIADAIAVLSGTISNETFFESTIVDFYNNIISVKGDLQKDLQSIEVNIEEMIHKIEVKPFTFDLFEYEYNMSSSDDKFIVGDIKNLLNLGNKKVHELSEVELCNKTIHLCRYVISMYYNIEGESDHKHIKDLMINTLIHCVIRKNHLLNKQNDFLTYFLLDTDNNISGDSTVLDSMFETDRKSKTDAYVNNYRFANRKYDIFSVYEIVTDIYNFRTKAERKTLYCTNIGKRPIQQTETNKYSRWSGIQVFDLDFKDTEYADRTDEIKQYLFKKLSGNTWFAWVQFSSSKKGLHIYTKVLPATRIYGDVDEHEAYMKRMYRINYAYLYSYIRYELIQFGLDLTSKKQNTKIIDNHMAKITQPLYIANDLDVLTNLSFCTVSQFHSFIQQPIDKDGNNVDVSKWFITEHTKEVFPDLFKTVTVKYTEKEKNKTNNTNKSNKENSIDASTNSEIDYATSNVYDFIENGRLKDNWKTIIRKLNLDNVEKGSKYRIRYTLINTLITVFDNILDVNDIRELAEYVLVDTKESEISSFLNCAIGNKKTSNEFGLSLLKKIGINCEYTADKKEEIVTENTNEIIKLISTSKRVFNYNTIADYTLNLTKQEYLGDKIDEIVNCLDASKVNILVSAPGTGKTELVKQLSKNYGNTVCLVEPFVSVIKSKFSDNNDNGIDFYTLFGDKNYMTCDKKDVVMTFDKFSTMFEDQSNFYRYSHIIIDESHLMFNSDYRIKKTAGILKNINKYIIDNYEINTKKQELVKMSKTVNRFRSFDNNAFNMPIIIFMTGTEVGESFYYNALSENVNKTNNFTDENAIKYYNKIKVNKEYKNEKNADIVVCKDAKAAKITMVMDVANAINLGKKCIIPTNEGTAYVNELNEQIESLVGRELKHAYYKKSNNDTEIVEEINNNATMSNVDILYCSSYLSVGVDINDQENINLFFIGETHTAESIEQYNNRLRKSNINCKIYVTTHTQGELNLSKFKTDESLETTMSSEMLGNLKVAFDFHNAKMDIIEKNKIAYLFFDELTKLVGVNKDNGRYEFIKERIDLYIFEKKYMEIATRPTIIKIRLVEDYGYNVRIIDNTDKGINEELYLLLKDIKQESSSNRKNIELQTVLKILKDLKSNKDLYVGFSKCLYSKIKIQRTTDINETGVKLETILTESGKEVQMYVVRVFESIVDAIDKILPILKSLTYNYSISDVYSFVKRSTNKKGNIVYKDLERIKNRMELYENADKNNIPAYYINAINNVRKQFESYSMVLDSVQFEEVIDIQANNVYNTILKNKSLTQQSVLKINENLKFELDRLFKISKSKKGLYTLCFEKLDTFSSIDYMNRKKIETIYVTMGLKDTLESFESMDDVDLMNISDIVDDGIISMPEDQLIIKNILVNRGIENGEKHNIEELEFDLFDIELYYETKEARLKEYKIKADDIISRYNKIANVISVTTPVSINNDNNNIDLYAINVKKQVKTSKQDERISLNLINRQNELNTLKLNDPKHKMDLDKQKSIMDSLRDFGCID